MGKQVGEAAGTDDDLFALNKMTVISCMAAFQLWLVRWCKNQFNFEFTDAVVGTANQWYMVTGAVVGIAAQRYMEYQCHGFASHPHSRAIVGIGNVTRDDSAGLTFATAFSGMGACC